MRVKPFTVNLWRPKRIKTIEPQSWEQVRFLAMTTLGNEWVGEVKGARNKLTVKWVMRSLVNDASLSMKVNNLRDWDEKKGPATWQWTFGGKNVMEPWVWVSLGDVSLHLLGEHCSTEFILGQQFLRKNGETLYRPIGDKSHTLWFTLGVGNVKEVEICVD